MKKLNKTDKAVIYKIIRELPLTDGDTPNSRYMRARDKYIESLAKNLELHLLSKVDARKYAFIDACHAAAKKDMRLCFKAVDAIKDLPEYEGF
jgi:hypothetical protein